MSRYKLIYFDFRGRGELCRLLFALAGQEYDDVRIKQEDWPAEKKKYIFNRVPVLEVEGKQYTQSIAIAGFLARQFGFHGKTDYEILEIDQVLGITGDIFSALVKAWAEKDAAELNLENKEKTYPRFIGFLETILQSNNNGFYVGDKLGLADVAAFEALDRKVDQSIIEGFPLVIANMEKVRANENIARWLANRPVTEH